VHIAFLLALVLLGGAAGSIRLITAFAAGQVAAVAVTTVLGRQFDSTIAEILVAVAVVLLAREALRRAPERKRVTGLAAGAGLFHGLALAGLLTAATGFGEAASWWSLLVLVLGMDAVLLVLAAVVQGLERLASQRWPMERPRRWTTYVVGATAVAAALTLAVGERAAEAPTTAPSARLPGLAGAASSAGAQASRRLAPRAPSAPLQSYLAVEPFEVRHEVLVRVQDLADEIGARAASGYLEIGAQDDVVRGVAEYVDLHTTVEIDGESASGIVDRTSFMTVDAQGVLPRQAPVREPIGEAFVGVTIVYLSEGMPDEVTLTWDVSAEGAVPIPATVIDPESSRSTMLTADEPVLRWTNELLEDPVPTITAVAVEPPALPVPLLSLALFATAVALAAAAVRGQQRTRAFAAARVTLALALAFATFAQVAIALPASLARSTSADQARRVLASVLPNVYRALDFRDEGAAYDRLAMSVTGETLSDIYLEHRRSLELEERGGARARVDAVEVQDVRDVQPRDDGGFEAEASWTVGGSVTHFGHRHFRQNRYDTRVTVVPVEGTWKIRSIEILEQERIR